MDHLIPRLLILSRYILIPQHLPTHNPNDPNKQQLITPNNFKAVITPSTSKDINQREPRQLNIIPPKKSIFISRFAFDTSADDIDSYIKMKLKFSPDILTKKFTYSGPRNITSFKVSVPFDLYEQIVDPGFWPNNTLVREYIIKENPRTNNIVRLPSREHSNPKN